MLPMALRCARRADLAPGPRRTRAINLDAAVGMLRGKDAAGGESRMLSLLITPKITISPALLRRLFFQYHLTFVDTAENFHFVRGAASHFH